MEDDDDRRIDRAAGYAPLDELAVLPQMRSQRHRRRQLHFGGSTTRETAPGG